MTAFRRIPGQGPEIGPSFNHGWRYWVAVGSAVVLFGILLCTIGPML